MPLELRPDQIEDLGFHIQNPRGANLNDPGTGKTPTMCVLQEYYWTEEKSRTFWPQPKSLIRKNVKELLKFTNFTPDDIAIYDGTPEQREKILKTEPKVMLMGFSRLGKDWWEIKKKFDDANSVVIDEWHLGFKGHKSARTQEMYGLMRRAKYFVPMSGTLINGRLDSAYPAIHIIEPRYYFDHNAFMKQHAVEDDFGRVLGWQGHEKIGEILRRHSVRRTFEEVHGKEKPIFQVEWADLGAKQAKAYYEMEEKALVELEDKFLEAANPAVVSIRCRQIMQHPYSMGITKPDELTHKDELILIHAENHLRAGTAFVVYSALIPEQEHIAEMLRRELGMKIGLINSNVSDEDRGLIDEAFCEGKLQGMVASPGTAAVGYNWHHIRQVIYASLDYNDTNFDQSYKRGIRGKRDIPLLVTVLLYDCRVDRRIVGIIQTKSNDRHKVDNTYDLINIL